MKRFTFWIPLNAPGDTAQEAWDNAMDAFAMALLKNEELAFPPETILRNYEMPSELEAEGFCIDHGEEDVHLTGEDPT